VDLLQKGTPDQQVCNNNSKLKCVPPRINKFKHRRKPRRPQITAVPAPKMPFHSQAQAQVNAAEAVQSGFSSGGMNAHHLAASAGSATASPNSAALCGHASSVPSVAAEAQAAQQERPNRMRTGTRRRQCSWCITSDFP
jgi:hypothetical protein